MKYTISAAAAFGMESVVKQELKNMGIAYAAAFDGRVEFQGGANEVARSNVFLRAADRIYIKLDAFPCPDFDTLFEKVKAVPWGDIIAKDGAVQADVKCVQSKLFSEPACQSIVKKAVIERLKQKYKTDRFAETGASVRIDVVIRKDNAVLSVDTSGAPLHKRGYRELTGKAPVKETLAAGLILLSRWDGQYFLDPFCGSGTFPIEAAMIARNIAPGGSRPFAFEQIQGFKEAFKAAREEAADSVKQFDGTISGFDIDRDALGLCRAHAQKAGVEKFVHFQQSDMRTLNIKTPKGFIVTNPPYGERLGSQHETVKLYQDFYKLYKGLDGWKCFVLCAHPEFQKHFARADRVRKIYNGGLECGFYQYGVSRT